MKTTIVEKYKVEYGTPLKSITIEIPYALQVKLMLF